MKKTRSLGILRAATLSLLCAAGATSAGCLTRPIDPLDSRTTWTSHFKQIRSGVDKIDLVLMIDNSSSMADKQAILSDAVPNLVRGLLNPPCVGNDGAPVSNQPSGPTESCPVGSAREFEPIYDVHIGILSSSLGGHGASACAVQTQYPSTWSNNDKGHLVARSDAAMPDQKLDTYQGKGFLAWDPKQQLNPPGEGSLDGAESKLAEMVGGVGQIGCGFESQLESWYRFLVDPEPYGSISLDGSNHVQLSGLDQELLTERADFLRPDSMVAILMLTDENDCSIREELDYPRIANLGNKMPRARQECEKDVNDRCCAPCDAAPADCPVDQQCVANPTLSHDDDPVNLRCWDQKRRYGMDFLYPVDRYTQALTLAKVAKRNGDLVDNPLYPTDASGKVNARTPEEGLVFLAGIVGVPWQDIARQTAEGKPDLESGLDADGKPVGGFMNASELAKRDPVTHQSRWDVILGDPSNGVLPLDPLMWESRKIRKGQNPITGDVLVDPNTSSAENPINGHEWNTDNEKDSGVILGDLQYACIFDLPSTKDCATASGGCDCGSADTDDTKNPLCQDSSGYTKIQRRAKGYPGIRELSVLKGVQDQGIVASVCPAQMSDKSRKNYGYSPAIGAIIDRLKHKLTGQCLTRPLTADKDGHVSCVVIEARPSHGGACCDGAARKDPDPEYAQAVADAKADMAAKGDDCFCQIDQVSGSDLSVCQNDVSVVPQNNGQGVDGWCYVDEQTGAPALVEGCSAGEKYKVRFVGAGQPASDAVTFITCAGGVN